MKASYLTAICSVSLILAAAATAFWIIAKPGGDRPVRSIASEPGGRPGSGASRADGQTDSALRRRLAELELKVAALTMNAAAQAEDKAEQARDAPSETEAPSVTEQIERDKAEWEGHMTEVAADFEAEPPDARWARDTASLLSARAGSDAVMRTAVKRIECRSSTCRVEMVDDQKGPFSRQLPVFVQSLGNVFPMAEARTVENADGTRTLSVYFSSQPNPQGAARGG
jgi:hypothetical protein